MPDRLIPPKPDDIIVWHDPVRRGMCRAAINGLDSAGSRRVQLRRYHVDAGGQMFPKAGVSFDPREFRQIAQHLLATLNDHPGATGASQTMRRR